MSNKYIGVDVGSASVRATLIVGKHQSLKFKNERSKDTDAVIAPVTVEPLLINTPRPEFFEQSSEQIWSAVCKATKRLIQENSIDPSTIKGIGFDATCSLVCLDCNGKPVSVSPARDLQKDQDPCWNVIMWMDHRAKDQAEKINNTKHPRLDYVGRSISLEMQPPKILWLKENLPSVFERILAGGHLMDLSDFLTFKATGALTRSLCCVTCKWLYNASPRKMEWDASFWNTIGLLKLQENRFVNIGTDVMFPGSRIGSLSDCSAAELGLFPATPVASGIIDAHAGVLGVIATRVSDDDFRLTDVEMSQRLTLIAGTSACHMALTKTPNTLVVMTPKTPASASMTPVTTGAPENSPSSAAEWSERGEPSERRR